MKNFIYLSALVLGLGFVTSCGDDEEEEKEDEATQICLICPHYLGDRHVCDNEDGTITLEIDGESEVIELEEDVTYIEYADEKYGNCSFDFDGDGIGDVGEVTDCVTCNGNEICKDRNGNAVFNGVVQPETSYDFAIYAQTVNGISCE